MVQQASRYPWEPSTRTSITNFTVPKPDDQSDGSLYFESAMPTLHDTLVSY